MSQLNKKLKAKINKLLALSGSPNEAEAAAALAKARELLTRSGMRMSDLSGEETILTEHVLDTDGSVAPWEEKLMQCVISTAYVQIIKIHAENTEKVVLIGRESNIVTAQILYDYLHDSIAARSACFEEEILCVESLRLGMVEGIRRKLNDRYNLEKTTSVTRELIVREERDRTEESIRFIREKYGEPEASDNWYGADPNSFGLGQSIASKISVDRQLSGGEDSDHS